MRLRHTDCTQIRISDGGRQMKRKKKKFQKSILLGFTMLYLVTMGLATYMVAVKYDDDYATAHMSRMANMQNEVSEIERKNQEATWEDADRMDWYQITTNSYSYGLNGKFVQFSAAVYDKEGSLLVKGQDMIGNAVVIEPGTDTRSEHTFMLDDFLSPQEKEELAQYSWSNYNLPNMLTSPEKYRFSVRTSEDGTDLYGIIVQDITWEEKTDEPEIMYKDPLTNSVYHHATDLVEYGSGDSMVEILSWVETGSEIIWEWVNPDISEEARNHSRIFNVNISFPYINSGYETWKKWSENEYFHNFPENIELLEEKNGDVSQASLFHLFRTQRESETRVWQGFDPCGYVVVRMEGYPLLAAVDYMKYVYLAGFVLMLACMVKSIHVTNKAYDQQEAMEETRRNFTNAMAHEMKTPLGIIRNFTENLQEHHMEEKRDYYLAQIISQTEEMDRLVTQMIEVSRLDSEHLILQKEILSLSQLIQEQAAKFEPMIREKNLQLQYHCEKDFQVEGDKEYLANAVWNLLSNAVTYNIPDGMIIITTNTGMCSIENTGYPMEEEQLAHVFDMFYNGDHSRSSQEKHMGMGLFLTKKILEAHNLKLSLDNTKTGIKAVVSI